MILWDWLVSEGLEGRWGLFSISALSLHAAIICKSNDWTVMYSSVSSFIFLGTILTMKLRRCYLQHLLFSDFIFVICVIFFGIQPDFQSTNASSLTSQFNFDSRAMPIDLRKSAPHSFCLFSDEITRSLNGLFDHALWINVRNVFFFP